jgi:hypothetical protein
VEPDKVQRSPPRSRCSPPGEAFGAILVDTMTASPNADVLDSVRLGLDELHQRLGHRPTVTVRRSEHGEVHALSLS